MSKNQLETLDWTRFTDTHSAIDLLKNTIGVSVQYDFYHGRDTFKAVALTPSIPLSSYEAAALPGGSKTGTNEMIGKYILKARIIDDNSPHSWIPDPCKPWKSANAHETMNLIMAHTTFIVYGDPRASMRVPVKPGDILSVKMTPRNGSYDLQYGEFVDVLERGGSRTYNQRFQPQKACQPLAKMFPVFPAFGDGMGPGPRGATYSGIRGTQAIQNGKLPMEILEQVNETYATPAKLLADVVPSFNALAQAYYEWTGTVNGGGKSKRLKINSSYRTYARQVSLGTLKDGTRNPLAATPGTSRHGWGCAFDWQLTIGWGNKSKAARRKQFNCPEWIWMWNNTLSFAKDDVYWTSPAWARPKDVQAPLYPGKGGLLEAWHWEPSNFGKIITGIGK